MLESVRWGREGRADPGPVQNGFSRDEEGTIGRGSAGGPERPSGRRGRRGEEGRGDRRALQRGEQDAVARDRACGERSGRGGACAAGRSSRGPIRIHSRAWPKKGLELLALAREETGLAVVTEVMAVEQVKLVADYADVLQVGARNMQNFNLLNAVGEQIQAGAAQAGDERDARRVSAGRRVHHGQGEQRRDALRARHPHLRRLRAKHAGAGGGAGAAPREPSAGHCRSRARGRGRTTWWIPCAGPRWPRARTG